MSELPVLPPSRKVAPVQQSTVVTGPWQLATLLSAPHRLGFATAALIMAVAALWWSVMLLARILGWPMPWAVPPLVAHGALMSLGFMPLFIVGFLFTAGPRWLDAPDVPATSLRTPVLLMLTGWLLTLPGIHFSTVLATLGVCVTGAGWTMLFTRFVIIWHRSDAPDKHHASMVAIACGFGVVAFALLAIGLSRESVNVARAGTYLALWGFLAPTFVTVAHRMIPFFTASALPGAPSWRPTLLLWVMLVPLWLQGAFYLWELWRWPLPAPARWIQASIELSSGTAMLWLSWRWGLVQSFAIRLLSMLHAAFIWLGIAQLLAGVSHGLMAASGDAHSLGLAPVHALTIGFLGSMMIAMTTRVAAGHSGRALTADNFVWMLYWCVHLAAILRISAELLPGANHSLTMMAIICWATAAVGWASRYVNWFGRPRIDGHPG